MPGGNQMDINIDNYEVFIIDYLDNKLGPLETAQLLLFLENHPGLKDEFEDLRTIAITPSSDETFGFNESLKQPADCDAVNLSIFNYSHYFIAATEGDLSETGYNLLNQFLKKHPELESEYTLFKSCRLKPDSKIHYPQPEKLKIKNKPVFMRYYLVTGIAASLLLLVTLFIRLTPETTEDLNKSLLNSIEQQANTNVSNTEKKEKEKESKSVSIEENGSDSQVKKSSAVEKKAIDSKTSTKEQKERLMPIRKIDKKNMIINTTGLISENKTMNFYSNLYDDIRLSQELAMAEKEDQEEIVSEKSLQNIRNIKAGRIINSVLSSGEQLAEQLPQSVSGWLFADLGVKGFNLLTNNNYSINRSYSEDGKIEQLKIKNSEKNL